MLTKFYRKTGKEETTWSLDIDEIMIQGRVLENQDKKVWIEFM
jgi:hypothetical protein